MQVLILYAAVVLIWGSTWIAITYQLGVVAEEVSVAYRFALGSVSLFVFAKLGGRQLRISREHYGVVILTGALMFSLNYLLTYYSINYIPSGLVAVAFSLIVVSNAMFERLIFKTPLENRLLIASLLGVIGICCLFWPEVGSLSIRDESLVGVLFALAAVLLASLGNMGAIVNNRRKLPVVAVNAHGMAWGALLSAIVALLLGREFTFSMEKEYILSLLYLSVVGSAIVFGCYLALIRSIGSARAAYTSVLFPLVALLISTFVEDYQWSLLAVTGVAFILAGNWLALTRMNRKKSSG